MNKRFFFADFPTASPYVTSVGATKFTSTNDLTVASEIAASVKTGSIITTGGGFSAYESRLSFQSKTLDAWNLKKGTMPPSNQYNINNRGYPDISLNGHNYPVYTSTSVKDQCPCKIGHYDGTSASSPALAGMISLINGHLLDNGKSSLGFINPLLYQM